MSVQAVKNPDPWKRLSVAAILSAYFCLAMEWLFFATKPSFLSALSWKESLSVLLRASTEVQRLLLIHLSENGYDISSLQRPRVDEEGR